MFNNPQKFMFDRQFDSHPVTADAQADLRNAELNAARAEAQQLGFEQGIAAAQSAIEGQLSAALETIGCQLAPLLAQQNNIEEKLERGCAQLSFKLADAMAGAALKQFPLERVAEVIHHTLGESLNQARIVVRLNADILEDAKSVVDDIAIGLGFSGKLIFIADDTCGPADVDLEWALGGMSSRVNAIRKQIISEFSQHYSAASKESEF
jgi:flagellar assembly protein FliH